MNKDLFYKQLLDIVQTHSATSSEMKCICDSFVKFLNEIYNENEQDDILKMTRLTILFEGIYHSLLTNSILKEALILIRINRWHNHFGTPTITFLLTFHAQIEKTSSTFTQKKLDVFSLDRPWMVKPNNAWEIDLENQVVVDKESLNNILMPTENEKTGQLLKTHNPLGGYTTTPCDPISQQFIEYAKKVAEHGGVLLDIGAAFGTASLQALSQGATVFCNDIDYCNLAVVKKRHLKSHSFKEHSISGDDDKLILVPGSFPDELSGLPKNFFDGILICRVLHFFTSSVIEKSLSQLFTNLKPGGKLFIVCETPYLKNWQQFVPLQHETTQSAVLPQFVPWVTKEILEKLLKHSSFSIEHLFYIDRRGQFPDEMLQDGRESVGAIVVKPHHNANGKLS